MKQQINFSLQLFLWMDGTLTADEIKAFVITGLTKSFADEASPMLNPFRIQSIREEANIYGNDLNINLNQGESL